MAFPLGRMLLLLASALLTVLCVGWVLHLSHYGIDLTDESFYLVWIADPFNYRVSVTQFGFIYHPLYELLHGNIAALRQANILITFGLAWLLGNFFLETVFGKLYLEKVSRLIISGSIATAALTSLVFAGLWLPTPSYNSLAFQSLLIVSTGLLLANIKANRESIGGWILIGVGGWLAFMAKPTTAAALCLCVNFYLLGAGKFNIRLAAVSVAVAIGFIVLSAFLIDGSIPAFFDRLKGGAELLQMLAGGHTFSKSLRLDGFQLNGDERLFFTLGVMIIFLAIYSSQRKNKSITYGGVLLAVAFPIISVAIILGVVDKRLYFSPFQGLLIWIVPFAAVSCGFAIYRYKGFLHISRSQWALAVIFLVLPYAYAFGSNNNYWIAGAVAGIFWILSGLVLLGAVASNRDIRSPLLSLGLSVQLIAVILIQSGIEAPYRQPQPLRDNGYKLEVGAPGSTLILSDGFGKYLSEGIELAKRAALKKGTPVIDLTGQSPGILYAIGASNIGQAWILGGYPGSEKFAFEALKKVPCEQISRAWLLVEPAGPLKISSEVVSSFNANMSRDFEVVGMLKTAEGVGGYKEVRMQQLWKPTRSVHEAMAACNAVRMMRH
ncbi:MAG: hypothetical protein U1E04_16535 [Hylemonella sp.]|nr:hypothetical protein [Hylemonella sp.]